MKFLKFLFSDKRGLKYFTFIIIPVFIYGMLLMTGNTLETILFGLAFILIPALIYLGFYGSSYCNYMQQQKFTDFYAVKIERAEKRDVVLYQKGFTLASPRTNYTAKINAGPRNVNYRFITLQGETVLLCHVYDLDRFRRYLKPLHLTNSAEPLHFKHTKQVRVVVRSEKNQTEIHFPDGEYAIVKLVYEE